MAYDQQIKQTINSKDLVPIVSAAAQANVTGNITSNSTAIVLTDCTGVGSVTVQFKGTHAGVVARFDVSPDGGTTWTAVNGYNITTNAQTTQGSTGTLTSNSTTVWNIPFLPGVDQFRVQATGFTSGSAAVVIHPSAQFTAPPNLATQPVSGTVATTQSTSPWITREGGAPTAVITQVTPTTTSTTLKLSNTSRKRLIVVNGGTGDLYISYGGTASATNYTFLIPSLGTATIPGEEYTGVVNGIWTATGGNSAQITETT